MLLNIESIKVKKRIRHSPGNLEPLKDSLRRYGLMNPITVNSKYELIAGERRLEAAKQLGWTSIEVQVVEVNDKINQLEMELEENNQRVPFSDEELLEGYALLEKLKNPGPFRKIFSSIKNSLKKIFILAPEKNLEEKLNRTKNISYIGILGIVMVVVSSILYKKDFITSIVHLLIDFIGVIVIIIGLFNLLRYIYSSKYSFVNKLKIRKPK